jgi:hypothetical protein
MDMLPFLKVLKTDCFTRHGLHFNGYGKDMICSQLALTIKNLFQHTEASRISLVWDGEKPV